MEDIIRKLLEDIFGGLGNDLIDIEHNITMTPEQAFSGSFWDTLLNICTKVFMPFAILILAFCIAFEMYNAYCRANGEIDVQLVSTTIFKFVIPFTLITRSYDIIRMLYVTFNKLVVDLTSGFLLESSMDGTATIESIMDMVNGMSWVDQLLYWWQISLISIGIKVMGVIIFVVVYGRIFEIMLFWLAAPLALSTLVHSEHNQIGKNYIKMFLALVFQGVLILLCVMMYSELGKNLASAGGVDIVALWQMAAYSAILVFCLLKTGQMSKRMFGTF